MYVLHVMYVIVYACYVCMYVCMYVWGDGNKFMYVCMHVWKYLQYQLLQRTSIYIYVYVLQVMYVIVYAYYVCMYVARIRLLPGGCFAWTSATRSSDQVHADMDIWV